MKLINEKRKGTKCLRTYLDESTGQKHMILSDSVTGKSTKVKKKKKKSLFKRGLKLLNPITGIKAGVKLAKKSIGFSLLAPLLPFKIAMIKKLESDGVHAKKMSFPKLVQTFHNKYVAKNKLEEVDNLEDNILFKVNSFDSIEQDSIEPATMAAVATGVIKLFKTWRDKRRAAKKAGKDPKKVMNSTDEQMGAITEKITQEQKKQVDEKQPETKGNMKKYLIIGGVIVLVLGLILYMRK